MITAPVIAIYKLLKARSLDGLSLKDLKLLEIKLNNKIDETREEINEMEKLIAELLEEAKVAKTEIQEREFANRIKILGEKIKGKRATLNELEKELRAVSNLLILKENEKDLKEAGAWEKLRKIDSEKLIKWLSSKKLEKEKREKIVNDINSLVSLSLEESYDEDVEDVLEVIRELKKGGLDTDKASKKIMKE